MFRFPRREGPARPANQLPDDHRRAFTAFVGGLLSDFDRYLADERADPTADGVTYQQAALWLTDAELAELLTELRAAVTARLGREAGETRTRRMISLVAVPAVD